MCGYTPEAIKSRSVVCRASIQRQRRIPTRQAVGMIMVVFEFLQRFGNINASFFNLPKDTEVLVNHSTYLNCSTSVLSNDIHWYHYHVGAETHEMRSVYAHGQLYADYKDYFRIDINISNYTKAYNLIIQSAKSNYAGTYVCQLTGGGDISASLQLIVLETPPLCHSSMKPGGIIGPNSCGIEPEELCLSCSTTYYGNIPPGLEWRAILEADPIKGNFTKETHDSRFVYNVTMKSDLNMDGSSYVCQTTRSTATQYNCTSDAVKILYIVNTSNVTDSMMNDEVICSANTSSRSCQYKWLWFNDTDFLTESDNQTLKILKIGQHRCEATCKIRNTECVVNASWLNASQISGYTTTATDSKEVSSKVVLAAVLAVLICLVFIILIVLLLRKCHRQYRASGERTEAKVEEATTSFTTVTPLESLASHQGESDKPTKAQVEPVRMPLVEDAPQESHVLLRGESGKTTKAQVEPVRTPLVEDAPQESHSLLRESVHYDVNAKILFTMRLKDQKIAITGLTILNEELFIVFEHSSEVEVYQAKVLLHVRSFMVVGLTNPVDLTSSPKDNCLYISSIDKIFRVGGNGKIIVTWPIEEGGGTLSVTDDRTIILSVWRRSVFREYSFNGELIHEVRLPYDIQLFHAVKLRDGHFVVSHQCHMTHDVCIVDVSGRLIRSFGGMVEFPKYLAVNSEGYIFVVVQQSSRVLLLSPTLEYLKVLVSTKDGLRSPSRIYLDEPHSQVFVADVKKDDIKVIVFGLQKSQQV